MKTNNSRNIVKCLMLGLVLLTSSAANSQTAKPEELAEVFASGITEYLGGEVDLNKTNDAGVPEALGALLEKKYRAHVKYKIAPANAELAKSTKLFNEAWGEYTKRRGQVAEALEKAASESPAAAIETLEAVVSRGKIYPDGQIKRSRGLVEACDAEVEAVVALAKLYAKTKRFHELALLPGYLMNSRVLGTRNSELLIFYQVTTRAFGELKFGDIAAGFYPVKQAADRILPLNFGGGERKYWAKGKRILSRNAHNLFRSLDGLGLKRIHPLDFKAAKRNEWVLFKGIYKPTIKGKSFKYKYSDKYKQAYGCKRSKEIDGFDLVTEKFTYKLKCKYRLIHKKTSVKAKLMNKAPDWVASRDKFQPVWLVGLVKKAGPNWVITKAQIVDLRFLGK